MCIFLIKKSCIYHYFKYILVYNLVNTKNKWNFYPHDIDDMCIYKKKMV